MRSVVAALAAVVVLVGCSDDPQPYFEPTPTTSPTKSPSAAEPEPWEEKSDEGAIAFVEHWLDLFRDAENTGETSELLAASTADCESCVAFAEEIDRVYGAGGRMSSEGWTALSFGTPMEQSGMSLSIPLEVRQSDQTVQKSEDAAPVVNPGIKVGLAASLVWQGEWVMSRLDIVR